MRGVLEMILGNLNIVDWWIYCRILSQRSLRKGLETIFSYSCCKVKISCYWSLRSYILEKSPTFRKLFYGIVLTIFMHLAQRSIIFLLSLKWLISDSIGHLEIRKRGAHCSRNLVIWKLSCPKRLWMILKVLSVHLAHLNLWGYQSILNITVRWMIESTFLV